MHFPVLFHATAVRSFRDLRIGVVDFIRHVFHPFRFLSTSVKIQRSDQGWSKIKGILLSPTCVDRKKYWIFRVTRAIQDCPNCRRRARALPTTLPARLINRDWFHRITHNSIYIYTCIVEWARRDPREKTTSVSTPMSRQYFFNVFLIFIIH